MTKEERKAYMKDYRLKNRERLYAHRIAWMAEHPGKHNEYTDRWRKKFPEKQRCNALVYVNVRRARKLDAFVEKIDPSEVLRRSKGRCGICKRPIAKGKQFHIDHIIPLSRGGKHSYENTQASHPACNLRKGKKEIQAIQYERRISEARQAKPVTVARPERKRRGKRT